MKAYLRIVNLALPVAVAMTSMACSKLRSESSLKDKVTVTVPTIEEEVLKVLTDAESSFYFYCDGMDEALTLKVESVSEQELEFESEEELSGKECSIDVWGKNQDGIVYDVASYVEPKYKNVFLNNRIYFASNKAEVEDGSVSLELFQAFREGVEEEEKATAASLDEEKKKAGEESNSDSDDPEAIAIDVTAEKEKEEEAETAEFEVGKDPKEVLKALADKVWISDDCQALAFKGDVTDFQYLYYNFKKEEYEEDCNDKKASDMKGEYAKAEVLYSRDDLGETLADELGKDEFVLKFTHLDGTEKYSRIIMTDGDKSFRKYGESNPELSDLEGVTDDYKIFETY